MSNLNDIHIGSAFVPQMHSNDLAAEIDSVKAYNQSIRVCVEAGDDGTKEMLESILGDEEDHVDWLEAQLTQIDQVGRRGLPGRADGLGVLHHEVVDRGVADLAPVPLPHPIPPQRRVFSALTRSPVGQREGAGCLDAIIVDPLCGA